MNQIIEQAHHTDKDGNPTGGLTKGRGITIRWQRGPLGSGVDRREPNGAFVEGVIAAAVGRLEHYQGSHFKCVENAEALRHLRTALRYLDSRTTAREARGVEGTHAV